MATELVDASKLDACCTAEANAIRAKTGSSAQIAYDWANSKGFADAIAAISGGGSNIEEQLITGIYNNDIVENNFTALGRVFSKTTGAFSVRMPELRAISTAYQIEASTITSLFAPKCVISGSYAFRACSNLTTVICNYLNGYLQFGNCQALSAVDLQSSSGKLDNSFSDGAGCPNLSTLILRGNTILTLQNTSTFNNTPFKSGGTGGTIYIPKTLYDALGSGTNDYKAATNWSTVDAYGTITWAQIEGSYYETHYADGTTI